MSEEFVEPQIDFDHLNRYVGGDPELTLEVFGLFKNQVDMWSMRLDPLADDEVWSMMAHSLKGTARAIGAVKLAEICQQAEDLVGQTRRDGAREVAVSKIEVSISQALIEIQRWEYKQKIAQIRSS